MAEDSRRFPLNGQRRGVLIEESLEQSLRTEQHATFISDSNGDVFWVSGDRMKVTGAEEKLTAFLELEAAIRDKASRLHRPC